MNVNLNKDQELVRETVSKIAQKELVLKAAEVDTTGSFVWKGIKKLKEAEIYAVLVRTDPSEGPQGISMLLIKKNTEGFSFCKKEKKWVILAPGWISIPVNDD